ncbi:hypothetical protein DICPUDRAFT_154455 [Dictyostelium purpureum]|uniref:Protoporphyrinogen oxidase n=1 Tax=Dictyostelium purpureum TaxID=5786 RepID=F0ZRD3_DICPU|nr:uncharacterized protein DICPUDRAFT_154455 [Dictyostelium purpureum]EGC33507.1 hypothetical protein DICPUDRAFT_154455 [Dictyostelium purpureum]|eukprot:XP_003289981.1 hypothetical protein DICPUDRAFT_154455 [Dictyostelium purpureum]
MLKKINNVGIIGGGVSGLSSYYYLRNGLYLSDNPNREIKINIYEKSNKLGGNIQTNIFNSNNNNNNKTNNDTSNNNIVVEKGPRSLRAAGKGLNTLELVKRLGISNDIIFSSKKSNGKFLLIDGKVQEVPMGSLFKIALFSLKYGLISAILKEPFQKIPKAVKERDPNYDESIFDFFSRRLGKSVTQRFIEPFCLGIYAGDFKKLSIKSCFPAVCKVEPFNGLILGNIFTSAEEKAKYETAKEKFEKSLIPTKLSLKEVLDKDIDKTGVFSFKENGLSQLIQKFRKNIESDGRTKLHFSSTIKEISKTNSGAIKIIDESGAAQEFDRLITTIPFVELAPMFKESDPTLSKLLEAMNYSSIAVVNFIYKSNEKVSNKIQDKGFGYLISSKENNPVIGVCFDSNTFPEFVNNNNNNSTANESIITIMIGGNKGISERNDKWVDVTKSTSEELINIASKHLDKYLDIESKPDFTNVQIYNNGIPHYEVGHQKLIDEINKHIYSNYSNTLLLGGNSLEGVGINDAIFKSKTLIHSLGLYKKVK